MTPILWHEGLDGYALGLVGEAAAAGVHGRWPRPSRSSSGAAAGAPSRGRSC